MVKTAIGFTLSRYAKVTIFIKRVSTGTVVRHLVSARYMRRGRHVVYWWGTNDWRARVRQGWYRIIVVASNRGPVSFEPDDDGELSAKRGAGGLVTALTSALEMTGGLWVACAMTEGDRELLRQLHLPCSHCHGLGLGVPTRVEELPEPPAHGPGLQLP